MLAELQDIVRSARPIVSQSIADAAVAGWLGGAAAVVVKLPDAPKPPAFASPPGEPPPRPPFQLKLFPEGDDDSLVKFPGLERAAEQLYDRQIMAPEDFYKLGAKAKQQAFTISGDLENASLEKLRDLLGETLQKGGNLDTFARAARGAFETLPISDTHLEQVYRNATNEAYSQGMERVLDHPVVSGGFPYRLYVPIHDARARHEHRDLERLGIDGTAVYHKDDPTWLKFRPPWDWGCRCGWIALSIKSAAKLGVREAQEWLATGIEPNHPPVTPPPFSPPASWDRAQSAAV